MLTVHHLGISQSDRIVWLCEELEIRYELKRYDRDAATRLAPADYKALSPAGTAPVITDGDLVLSESGAIIDYIIGTYGDGRLAARPDDADYTDYLFWYHYAQGSLMPAAMLDMVVTMLDADRDAAVTAALLARATTGFALAEARVAAVPYFAGDRFSAADIVMMFPLTTMQAFSGRDMTPYPAIRAYAERIAQRPAFARAMAKAEPGMPLPG